MNDPTAGPTTNDGPRTTEVRDLLGGLATAWNAGDADAYGDLFTPDATYVTFDGDVLRGRDQIVEVHRFLFAGPLAGSRMGSSDQNPDGGVAAVREIAPSVLHVITGGAVRLPGHDDAPSPGEPDDRASVQSYAIIRNGDCWRVSAFHNCRREQR